MLKEELIEQIIIWWAWRDSNSRSTNYEFAALGR